MKRIIRKTYFNDFISVIYLFSYLGCELHISIGVGKKTKKSLRFKKSIVFINYVSKCLQNALIKYSTVHWRVSRGSNQLGVIYSFTNVKAIWFKTYIVETYECLPFITQLVFSPSQRPETKHVLIAEPIRLNPSLHENNTDELYIVVLILTLPFNGAAKLPQSINHNIK